MRKILRLLGATVALVLLATAADLAWLGYSRATITSQQSKVTASGNGSTTVFSFPFVGVQASDIKVTYTDASGNSTVLSQGTQYLLSLNAATVGSVWGIGGSVTYPISGSPIASGTTLTIERVLPYTQVTSSNQGQLFPQAIETAMDLLEMQVQQVSATVGRSLVVSTTDTCSSLGTLPNQTQRANQLIGFDSTGCTPIVAQPSSALVSSAMQPVVAASTIPAAQALLGIGSSANVPVGAEVDWPGLVAPSYWHLEDGSALSRVTYSSLLSAIAPVVPCTITNGSTTITGISSTVGWAPGWIIESPGSTALGNGVTISSVGGSSVTVTGGTPTANATSCQIFPYGTAQNGTFNLPSSAGTVYAGIDSSNTNLNSTYFLANPGQLNALGGLQSHTLLEAELPVVSHAATRTADVAANFTYQAQPQYAAGSTNGIVNIVTTGSNTPVGVNFTQQPTFSYSFGGGGAHSIVQPTRIRNKIIFTGVL